MLNRRRSRCIYRQFGVPVSVFQGGDVGQGELWVVLTDPSLQEEREERPERPCRRTAALCVSTSCVLTSSVVRALKSSAACHASFRDVIKEHGRSLLQIKARHKVCVFDTNAAVWFGFISFFTPANRKEIGSFRISPCGQNKNSIQSLSSSLTQNRFNLHQCRGQRCF